MAPRHRGDPCSAGKHYIGTRRMELVDPKWGTHKSVPLDGAASTVDDLDDRFGFQFPNDRPVLEPVSVPQTQRRVKKK